MNPIRNIINYFNSWVSSGNFHFDDNRIKTNYYCAVCQSTGRPPNMLGRFVKINNLQEQCNGCGTIFNVVTHNPDTQHIPVATCVMIRD
jgi:hypothetical protein